MTVGSAVLELIGSGGVFVVTIEFDGGGSRGKATTVSGVCCFTTVGRTGFVSLKLASWFTTRRGCVGVACGLSTGSMLINLAVVPISPEFRGSVAPVSKTAVLGD